MKASFIFAVVFAALTSTSALAAQVQNTNMAAIKCTKQFTKDANGVDRSAEEVAKQVAAGKIAR